MGKVGILSLYKDNYNYGALLQARALVEVVKTFNIDCEQISYNWYTDTFFRKVNSTSSDYHLFSSFEKEIPHSTEVYTDMNIASCESVYECIIVGSDQVWNDELGPMDDCGGLAAFLLLPFGEKIGKIAYAASFGKDNVTKLNREVFSEAMERFDCISVRELSGIKLINDLNPQVEATKVLDPTMLLSADDWRKYKKKVDHKKKYIVAYLLGSSDAAKLARRKAERIATVNDMELIILPDKKYGPAEFLDLIDNAEFVFSNSFHGTVFSIIFEKNFRTIGLRQENDSKATNSRMKDLLSEMHLEKYYLDVGMIEYIDILETPAYGETRLILEEKRKESLIFLKNGVKGCKKEKIDRDVISICEKCQVGTECEGEQDERALKLFGDYWGNEEERNGIRRVDMEKLFYAKGVLLKEKCLSCPNAKFRSFYHKLEGFRFYNDVRYYGVEGLYYRYLLDNERHSYERTMILDQNRTRNQIKVANAVKMKRNEKYMNRHLYIYGAAITGRALAKLIHITAFIDASEFYKVHPYVEDIPVLGLTEAAEKVESDAVIVVTPWWDISLIKEKLDLKCEFVSLPDFVDDAFE